MFKKLLSTPLIFLCISLLLSFSGYGQNVIRFKTQRASSEEAALLDQHFKAYTLSTLGTEQVSNLLRSKDFFPELLLEAGGNSFSFNLRARDLRAPHYKLKTWNEEQGIIELPRSPNMTYYGFTHEDQYDVRITADEDYFSCLILQHGDALYIEPAKNIVPGAAPNLFVIYWSSDNLKKFTANSCGVHSNTLPFTVPTEEDHEPTQHEFSSRACKVVQIALADDHLMFNQYGSVSEVEEHNMTVINNVETNYDFEFNDDLQFTVVTIFVATSAANDPWTNSNDPGDLLDDFTDWAPGGFGTQHDVGGLWSNRNFTGDVIGLAWVGAVCTNFKYHVLEDFTSNADFLRVLQAHEMGHNFNANHDAAGSGTIMAPSVNNTNNWSAASINSINNYISNVNCLSACGVPQAPVANFDADPTEGCTPLVVSFDDQSLNNPTSWSWTFQGGTPGTSTQQNPTVTYNTPGDFNVTLFVSNAQGNNSLTMNNFITVGEEPFADFDYMVDDFSVDFENLSEFSTSYFWQFGDGATSTTTNPLHVYAEDGVYTVTLTASNSCGTDVFIQVIEIITFPYAAFDSDIVEGCDPFEVEFINLSSDNADSYFWSFPGGSPPNSNAFEPIVVYETPGSYPVSLTVYNEAGDDILTIANYITVIPQPMAEFDFTTNGLQVNFNSTGSLGDDFFWNFGDGHVSTAPNPVHIYTQTGNYQVSLTVSNDCGSENLTLNVSVTGAPEAALSTNTTYGCLPLVVQFTNQSGGIPTSFSWVFQGGSPATSTQANPVVTYNTPGLFDVTLTVSNVAGSDVLFLNDYIEVEFPTVSSFNHIVNGLIANFFNQSSNDTGSFWDFGDGFTSTQTSPTHVYNQDGIYTVNLISTGICGNDTSTAQVIIQTPPQASFSFQQSSGCVPATVLFINESSNNATAFSWSFPGGSPSSSNLENPSVVYNVPGTYDVNLIAFSAVGSDTMMWTQLVAVGQAPSASFLFTTDVLTLTTANVSSAADSYLWSFGDGGTSTAENPVHTYASFGTYVLSLITTNNCGSDTMQVVLELSTVPNAFFGYSAQTGCSPFEVQFIDQSQNNPTSWSWTFAGGEPPTSNEQNPVVIYTTPGIHSVSLQVSNIQGTDVLILDGLIQVGSAPDATFSYNQIENVLTLEYPGLNYDSLTWDFGNGQTDHSFNPIVEYNTSGQYLISLIVYNSCGTDTSFVWVTINITSSSNPSDNKAGWQIRPNPFKDILTIYGLPDSDGQVKVSLVDPRGQLISEENWNFTAGEAMKEFSCDHLPSGVILVLIQDATSRVVLKAVHQ